MFHISAGFVALLWMKTFKLKNDCPTAMHLLRAIGLSGHYQVSIVDKCVQRVAFHVWLAKQNKILKAHLELTLFFVLQRGNIWL